MSGDITANALLYLLFLILPVAALMTRRVPLMRVVGQLEVWVAIFGLGLLALGQRERFDP